jgi:hypothetical protein
MYIQAVQCRGQLLTFFSIDLHRNPEGFRRTLQWEAFVQIPNFLFMICFAVVAARCQEGEWVSCALGCGVRIVFHREKGFRETNKRYSPARFEKHSSRDLIVKFVLRSFSQISFFKQLTT